MEELKNKGYTILKVTGIIYIIYAILTCILSVLFFVLSAFIKTEDSNSMVASIHESLEKSGILTNIMEFGSILSIINTVFLVFGFLLLLLTVISIICAFVNIKYSNEHSKANLCLSTSIIFAIIGLIISMITMNFIFISATIIISVFSIIGCVLNKQEI